MKILDESHYYPFGLKHNKYSAAGFIWSPAGVIIAPIANNPFKYKFQSQELQEDHNLNWYSYRYRNYDPAIGRFFNVDPLSESFAYNGVYNFSENRVIDAFELEGLESVQVNGEEYADFDRNGEMDIVALDGATIFSGVSQPIKNASASIDWGPLVSKGIEFSNGWQQGKQDFVSDTYQNLSHDLYTRDYWEGKAGNMYNLAQLNSNPVMKYQLGSSIYNASAYDWGHFAGYEGTSFAVSYAATAGLGEIGSIGSAFGRIKIPKFGVNKTVITAEGTILKTGGRVFTQTAKDGDLLFYSTKIGDDVVEFGGNFSKSNGTLTIKNFDIDGALTNKLGIRGVKDVITDFGRQQGVNQVIIQGAKRTTGANPGKIPSQLIFKID